MDLEFTQSARRHRIGRTRVRQVIENPIVTTVIAASDDKPDRLVFLGTDDSGRALEVVAVQLEDRLLVIHAMDLRAKWRKVMEEGQK